MGKPKAELIFKGVLYVASESQMRMPINGDVYLERHIPSPSLSRCDGNWVGSKRWIFEPKVLVWAQRTEQEDIIKEVLLQACGVQDFLWGDREHVMTLEQMIPVLQKRIDKLEDIHSGNRHAKVEIRKRLLQLAAVSIAMLESDIVKD